MVISHKNLIQLFDLIKSRWFSAQRPRMSIAPFRHRLEAQGRDTHTESTAWRSKTLDFRLSRLGSLLHWLRRSYWDRALKLSFKDQRSFVWESRGKGAKGIPGRGRTMCAKGTVTKGNTVFTEMRRVCDSSPNVKMENGSCACFRRNWKARSSSTCACDSFTPYLGCTQIYHPAMASHTLELQVWTHLLIITETL